MSEEEEEEEEEMEADADAKAAMARVAATAAAAVTIAAGAAGSATDEPPEEEEEVEDEEGPQRQPQQKKQSEKRHRRREATDQKLRKAARLSQEPAIPPTSGERGQGHAASGHSIRARSGRDGSHGRIAAQMPRARTVLMEEALEEMRNEGRYVTLDEAEDEVARSFSLHAQTACFGSQFFSVADECTPGFQSSGREFGQQFCDNCQDNILVPFGHIIALSDDRRDFSNKGSTGVWSTLPCGRAYRLINNTIGCQGPQFVVFRELAPAAPRSTVARPAAVVRLYATKAGCVPVSARRGKVFPFMSSEASRIVEVDVF